MAQIIQHPNFGADLGSALGTGLSEGLRELAEGKLRQLHKSRKEEAREGFLKSMEGFSPTFATALSKLSDEEYSLVLPEIMKEKREKSFAQNYLGAQQPEQRLGFPVQEEQQTNMGQQKYGFAQAKQQPGMNQLQADQDLEIQNQVQKEPNKIANTIQRMIKQGYPVPKNSKEATDLIQTAFQLDKEELQRQAATQKEVQKETLPVKERIDAQAVLAKKADQRINIMKKYDKEGGLPNETWYKLIDKMENDVTSAGAAAAGTAIGTAFGLTTGGEVGGALGAALGTAIAPGIGTALGGGLGAAGGAVLGGALGALASPIGSVLKAITRRIYPDTEAFEKLQADFVKDTSFLQGTVTDGKRADFLKTIPTLSNTAAGRKAIYENIEEFNRLAKVEQKVANKIVRENDGKRPYNFQEQIDERMAPVLEESAQDINEKMDFSLDLYRKIKKHTKDKYYLGAPKPKTVEEEAIG